MSPLTQFLVTSGLFASVMSAAVLWLPLSNANAAPVVVYQHTHLSHWVR